MVPLHSLPGFWHFMYRVSPFTYLISAFMSTGFANHKVTCSDLELLHFNPPAGQTCGQYMEPYMSVAGGAIYNPQATSACEFCTLADTNAYLATVDMYYHDRWRNIGLVWAYILFNICAALFMYWLARVPKKGLWKCLAKLRGKFRRQKGV
jgi:ATP-binding cassette, subfamily G (WHITE), member 2, PDR